MDIPLLKDVVIIFVLAMVVVYISHRLKMPAIVGLLVTGVLAGPHALGLIEAEKEVEQLAKIGVILLLFTIGIEFSLRKLMKIKTLVLVGGSLQVGATVFAVFAGAYYLLDWSFGAAMFMGFLISLSSTAIVLKMLQDRAEIESAQGRIALGILIYQDIIVVLFIILTPFLAGESGGDGPSVFRLAATGVALVLFVIFGSRYLIPAILHQTIRTRNRELFLLTVGGICMAVAFAAAELSLALGAFLAGLTISESEYSHEVLEHITPFRDLFTSFFFVSVGMLLNLEFMIAQPLMILLFTAAVLLGKSLIVTVASVLLGFPLRTAIISGLNLSQVGEFAFILATVGAAYSLLTPEAEQMFLAVSVLTMAGTSFIMAGAPRIADRVLRLPVPPTLERGMFQAKDLQPPSTSHCVDHLVLVGFGLNGRNVAKAARYAGIPYAIIEMNADTVRAERQKGEPIYFGDATQEAVLKMVNIESARTVVVVIQEAVAVRRIVGLARQLNPRTHIIARTRYVSELEPLRRAGANEVIPEEFETSVEIFTRVLTKYLVPREEVATLVTEIRGDGYQMLRRMSPAAAGMSAADLNLHLSDIEIAPMFVPPDSPMVGRTLAEIDMRNRTGLNLLAIRRNGEIMTEMAASTCIEENDELFVIGPPEKVAQATLALAT
jgi:CPA2 family monovalent cation:H+ antiporter-2